MAEAARRRGNPDAAQTVARDLLALAGLGAPERQREAEVVAREMLRADRGRVKFGARCPLEAS